MTDQYYLIAGTYIQIKQEKEDILINFRGFETEIPENRDPDIVVEVYQKYKIFHQWYGVEYSGRTEKYPHLFISKIQPKTRLLADATWRKLVIEGACHGIDGVMEIFLCAFYSYLSRKGMLLIHASCINWRGEGIIFTAASGVGKTTQAELWAKYKKAEIINGDKVIVECGNKSCYAWGSPWKGSSPYGINKRVPLKALLVLSQSKNNYLKKLSVSEIMEQLFPHVFFPSWNELCADQIIRSLDSMINHIPVYHLSCRPDEAAVELVCRSIWGES